MNGLPVRKQWEILNITMVNKVHLKIFTDRINQFGLFKQFNRMKTKHMTLRLKIFQLCAVSLFISYLLTGILCDFVLTDQYLANIIPGRMYYKIYDDMGLERYYLSRTLEDGGSLWSPMFPWNGCGAYQSATLGVGTFTYFPYAFLNLVNPIVSIIMAYLGIAVFRKKLNEKGVEIIDVENMTELDKIRNEK